MNDDGRLTRRNSDCLHLKLEHCPRTRYEFRLWSFHSSVQTCQFIRALSSFDCLVSHLRACLWMIQAFPSSEPITKSLGVRKDVIINDYTYCKLLLLLTFLPELFLSLYHA